MNSFLSSQKLKTCCYSSHSALHISADLAALLQGRISHSHLLQIHAQIFVLGAHHNDLIATRLIGHYPSHIALRVFHGLRKPNVFPFNAIIRVYSEQGLFSNAFSLFKTLKQSSPSPNDFTFSFLLKSCSFRCGDSVYVKQIHTHVVKMGFLRNEFVCNGLLAVYAKGLRDLGSARQVFDEMPDKGVVCCWTSLIAGYAQSGKAEEALRLFVVMVEGNLRPEDDTMVSVLSACSNLDMSKIEKWVLILSRVFDNVDSKNVGSDSVNAVLVYLYGKWGEIEKSRETFDGISDSGKRSVLPWNAIIGAYVQNGFPVESLSVFRVMVGDPTRKPNHVTMVSVLSACAQVGDLELGRWVHEYLKSKGNRGVIGSNRILATALIDMYSKCGSLEKAKEVFHQMVSKDIVSFNAMIMGLAVNSEGEEALRLFSKIQDFGLQPNAGTFLGALCACNHSGFSEEGRQIFKDMTSGFSIAPKLEHYACYIDLLARVGLVEEALEVVTSMPFEPNSIVWGALLGGCLLHSRLDYAEYVSRKLVQSDPNNTGGYVMLANAFASDHRWGDVSSLRRFMREKGVTKQPGCSWISINGVVHEFLVGCSSHSQSESISSILNGLVKQMKIAIDIL
ncbi:pentatricopeptide repeat-containing protein At3g12770-like [Rosa rugosa]|uniref:pentatricopeptide repeat-containing protein At3g12770-like n=1 Tax=Rosa rugosa TaxID=74645 RepID=UPI002B4140F4|nr:pentatricopeptide repeat-containing protein At3g12770-like [Rosa rugosa]